MDRIEHLRAFVRVVEEGSFSAAAERLGLAKSAVSRRISELERALGARLLNRSTRRLSLTEIGRAYHERVSRILAELDEANLAVRDEQHAIQGLLRIAAPVDFGRRRLAPLATTLMQEHPQLQVELDLDDRPRDVVDGGFDLVLCIGEPEDSNLVARRLATMRYLACASPDYLAAHGAPRTPAELEGHPALHHGLLPRHRRWRFRDTGGRLHEVSLSSRLRANNGEAVMAAACAGLGVAVLPTCLVCETVTAGQLVPLLRDYDIPAEALYALYPSRRYLASRVRRFLDHLAETFEQPDWDRFTGAQECRSVTGEAEHAAA